MKGSRDITKIKQIITERYVTTDIWNENQNYMLQAANAGTENSSNNYGVNKGL
jgi:hypothetical protein